MTLLQHACIASSCSARVVSETDSDGSERRTPGRVFPQGSTGAEQPLLALQAQRTSARTPRKTCSHLFIDSEGTRASLDAGAIPRYDAYKRGSHVVQMMGQSLVPLLIQVHNPIRFTAFLQTHELVAFVGGWNIDVWRSFLYRERQAPPTLASKYRR